MLTLKEQTKAAKKALNAAGYNCSVKKGTGSARCWIYVAIRDRVYSRIEDEKIGAIVVKATGRRDIFDEISIEFSYREYIPAKCICGATGTDLNRIIGADDLERIMCRSCGATVI
jgi:hypothetical protein